MNAKHGGKRPNAGRKKGIPTTTIRVPIHLVKDIKNLIHEKTTNHNPTK